MKKKAQKKCKRIANYRHTIGVINSYTYKDYKTGELVTRYYGEQKEI